MDLMVKLCWENISFLSVIREDMYTATAAAESSCSGVVLFMIVEIDTVTLYG